MKIVKLYISLFMMTFAIMACGEKKGGMITVDNSSSKKVENNKGSYANKDKSCSTGVSQQIKKMNPRLRINCQKSDSLKVISLLTEAANLKTKPDNWMIWFGKKLAGIPYVGGTLDRTSEEELIINLRELDCTTFVEQVLALSECASKGKETFNSFVNALIHVRYVDGKVEYVNRQHYFTVWINDNEKEGLVKSISPNPPFTAVQHVSINYMSTHTGSYKMLTAHPEWTDGIRQLEQSVSGKSYRYIPKSNIVNTKLMRSAVHTGDIIAIITNKKGLDTTHIGIAIWHKDGLHLLNASSIHKKVIDEPMLLRTYMMKHPVQIGIRIARPIL